MTVNIVRERPSTMPIVEVVADSCNSGDKVQLIISPKRDRIAGRAIQVKVHDSVITITPDDAHIIARALDELVHTQLSRSVEDKWNDK